MSSTSQRQGSKTQSSNRAIAKLRSLKTRSLAVFTLVLLSAVFSASALTANLGESSVAANVLSIFSAAESVAAAPAETTEAASTVAATGNDDPQIEVVYSNPAPIIIPGTGTGATTGAPANPYPSNITVAGAGASVQTITVTLNAFSHTFPDDVDVLLVGPGGQTAILMSDVGGSVDTTGQTYTFATGAPAMADSALNPSGTYSPTNFGTGDAFPAPAPASGPSSLATFIGGPANGTWSLYVVDDAGGDSGTFAGGWSLDIGSGASSCAAPPAQMIAWYPGENNANDIIGGNQNNPPNNGTYNGAYGPGFVQTSQATSAFDFDGVDDVFVAANSEGGGLDAGNGAGISGDAWINPDNAATSQPIFEWNSGTGGAAGPGVHFWKSVAVPNTLYLNVVTQVGAVRTNNITSTTSAPLVSGVYQHVAFTYNKANGAVAIYYNGVAQPLTVADFPDNLDPATNDPFYIGHRPAGGGGPNYFAGLIDESEIFNRSLSGAEVASISDAGIFGKCRTSRIQFSTATASVGESAGSYTITVTRVGANDTAASALIELAPGTALEGTSCATPAGADYVDIAPGTRINFAPNERFQQISVQICGDGVFEGPETFTATLSDPSGIGATIGVPNVQTITITDDEAAGVFSVNSPSAPEGSPLMFVITRAGPPSQGSETVCYNTQDVTAVAPGDYTAIPVTCTTFAPGQTTFNVNVTTNQDNEVEPNETMRLVLSGITGGSTGNGAFGTGMITNNDNTVRFNPTVYTVTEPNTGQTIVVLTVERGPGSDSTSTFTVDVSTIPLPGTATGGAACTAGIDYITTGTTLTFGPGVTSLPFNVPVCGDLTDEPDEFFTAQLTNPQPTGTTGNTTIDPAGQFATVNIIDNDPFSTFASNNPPVVEPDTGTANLVFTVTRSGASDQQATVTYTLVGVTATGGGACTTPGVDFINQSGTLTFPAGTVTQPVTVVVCGDTVFEGDETLTLDLTPGTNAGTATDGTGTIIDAPDPVPTFAINDVQDFEGDSGTKPFNFTITRTGNTSQTATVTYRTEDGNGMGTGTPATAPSDYNSIPSFTAVFPPGVSQITVPVIVNGDTMFEDNETFSVIIDSVTFPGSPLIQATVTRNRGIGTILNDDGAPVFSVAAAGCTVTEPDPSSVPNTVNCVFTITRSGNATQMTSIVTFTTVDQTAVAPGDYIAQAGTVTFAPGDTTKTVSVVVNGDDIVEGTETFLLRLTNVTNGSFGTTPAVQSVGTILDDEGTGTLSVSGCTVVEPDSGTIACNFVVTRSLPANGTSFQAATTFTFATANGSATAPSDFTAVSGTFTIAANASSITIPVLVNGDTVNEPTEMFTGTISAPSGNVTIATATATGTITNNDNPGISISDVTQNEGNSGTTAFVFTVTRTGDTTLASTVNYSSADGTAISPIDYTQIAPGTLAFAPGVTTLTLTVQVNGDLTVEPNKTFFINLSGAVNAIITDAQGVGTIVNDDGVPVNILGTITNAVGGTPIAGVTVTLSGSSNQTTTTNTSGFFQFTGLPSGGNFLVTPSQGTLVFSPTSRSFNNLTTSVANANFIAFANQAGITRNLRVTNGFATAGSPTNPNVGINLTSLGDEAELSFSLAYDPARLGTPTVTCGTAAPNCTLVANTSVPGQIGITVGPLDAGGQPTTFAAGDRNIVNISFTTTATSNQNTPITFTDVPTIRRTSDSGANPLPTTYTNGFVVFGGQGLEGDVAPRPNGDGAVIANDVVQTRRFVAGLDIPDPSTNERQRADTSPAATRGDGQLDATDVIQTRRYAAGLDPTQPAGGPGPIANPMEEMLIASAKGTRGGAVSPEAIPRIIRVQTITTGRGIFVLVGVELDAEGGEDGASFTLAFDQTRLSIAASDVTLGAQAQAAGFALTVNPNNANIGRIGALVDCLCPGLAASPPTNRIVNFRFFVAANAATGFTPITIVPNPVPAGQTPFSVSDQGVNVTSQVVVENGGVFIIPSTAAGVTVGGRVTIASGAALRNANVTITDSAGARRTVITNSFGYYSFEDVEAGGSYVISVASRRYRFASRVVNVSDSITDVDFVAAE